MGVNMEKKTCQDCQSFWCTLRPGWVDFPVLSVNRSPEIDVVVVVWGRSFAGCWCTPWVERFDPWDDGFCVKPLGPLVMGYSTTSSMGSFIHSFRKEKERKRLLIILQIAMVDLRKWERTEWSGRFRSHLSTSSNTYFSSLEPWGNSHDKANLSNKSTSLFLIVVLSSIATTGILILASGLSSTWSRLISEGW